MKPLSFARKYATAADGKYRQQSDAVSDRSNKNGKSPYVFSGSSLRTTMSWFSQK
jgi:hypothetical protein